MTCNILNKLSLNITDEFLKEEIRSGYTVTTQMKKVWAYEMDLVQELLRVCNKHQLKCWLDAGSLLGAVRHKGFIPWDDDMDMRMFRNDYDKLVAIASKEFLAPYLFQTAYTDKKYIRGHAQLRNTKTTAILPKDIHQQFNQGIFIDIFVLDGVSDDSRYLSKQKRKVSLLKILMSAILYGKISFKHPRYSLFSFFAKLFWGFNDGHIKLFKKQENLLRAVKIKDVEYVAPLGFIFETGKRIRNKHLYDETVMLDFENIQLPAPVGYHEFLSNRYGDYMHPSQLPTTHGCVVFDTERPSEEVLKELRKKNKKCRWEIKR
jgi:phosphorylcholine metabolism protein LicD